jgi:DNA replication protein DnaC
MAERTPERAKQFGVCDSCGDEFEQELWGGVWCPSACGKCREVERVREEREMVARYVRQNQEEMLKRRIENSGVKRQYREGKLTLRSYDPTTRSDRPADQLERERKAMVACEEWVLGLHSMNDQNEERRGLYLFGEPGLGKSHYAQAALIAAIKRGAKGTYVKFGDLLSDARDAMFSPENQMSERRFVKPFVEVDCLVVDDLGAMEKASEFTLRIAYALIEGRMSKEGRTIITANYNLAGLRARLLPKDSDPIEANRILDRILEYCELVEFKGESYR